MNNIDPPSAKIYQFPSQGRRKASSRREPAVSSVERELRGPTAAVGSAWYHDAAIRESDARMGAK